MIYKLNDIITRSNTGLDAIRRAPIVERETGIKCIRITDISQKKLFDDWGNTEVLESDFDKFQLKKEDILIARTGATIGVNRIINEDLKAVYNNGLIRIQINKKIANPRFVYYSLNTNEYWGRINAVSSGTVAQPNMKMKDLLDYELNIPSIDIQNKIVKVLNSIDDKIELNNEINDNLQQQAEGLYKEYFDNASKDSKNISLDFFCNIFTGKKNSNANEVNGKYKFFTCSPNPLLINSYIYDGNAIIVSGNGAYTGRTRFYKGKFDLYQRTYACTLKSEVEEDYLFPLYWFVKFNLSKKIMGGTRGSAIPYIVMNDLAKFEFPFDKELFEKTLDVFKTITLTIQENENQNENLSTLRDSLLPKLMSGEIDVDSIEL